MWAWPWGTGSGGTFWVRLEIVDDLFRFPEADAGIQLPVAFDCLDFPALPNQGQHILPGSWRWPVELLAMKLAR